MSNQVNLEIETLLSSTSHGGIRDQELLSFFKPETVENHHNAWQEWNSGLGKEPSGKRDPSHVEKAVLRDWYKNQKKRQLSESSDEEKVEEADCIVKGKDIGDANTQYTAKGLQQHEMPVIGKYTLYFIM